MTAKTQKRRRRVGPTGELVWSGDPIRQRAEWLAERQKRMQSTDVGKVIGVSKHGTALDVWADKTGREVDDEAGEAAEWGLLLEPVIAAKVQRDTGVRLSRVGITAHRHEDWMGASIDRLEGGCPLGPGFREVKTRNAFVAGNWNDEIPDDVLAQTQWDLLVTGYNHAHVDCLIGGQELRTYLVRPEPDVQRLLIDEALRIWKYVQADERPPVDPDQATERVLDALDRLVAHVEGSVEVDSSKALPLIDAYLHAQRAEIEAKAAKKAAEAGLAVLADGHETALINGRPAYTRKPGTWSGIDAGARERLQTEFPDAFEACWITKPTRPVLRMKKEYKL